MQQVADHVETKTSTSSDHRTGNDLRAETEWETFQGRTDQSKAESKTNIDSALSCESQSSEAKNDGGKKQQQWNHFSESCQLLSRVNWLRPLEAALLLWPRWGLNPRESTTIICIKRWTELPVSKSRPTQKDQRPAFHQPASNNCQSLLQKLQMTGCHLGKEP